MSTARHADAADWFVGRVEDSDGVLPWGELAVSTRDGHDDGATYDLRHDDDVRRPTDTLEQHDEPADARRIARSDGDGGYRPLKGERSLRSGWVFPSLSAPELVEAVGYIYPTSIEDEYLHRRGELETTDYGETAGRQTGMYSSTDELDGDQLRAATEAFCGDCARRREWGAGDGTRLDAGDGGDFACAEACSMLLTGAREFVAYDDETVTVELRRGELGVLTDALTALDDRCLPRRGEVDDAGNRFVARYLRHRLAQEVDDVRG